MDFITIKEAAEQWQISSRRVQVLCAEGRIKGAFKHGNAWFIPKEATKPKQKKRGLKADKKHMDTLIDL